MVQEYEIECPDTKTKFSLKTGEITDWCASTHTSIQSLSAHFHRISPAVQISITVKHETPRVLQHPGRYGAVGTLHILWVCRYPTNPVLRAVTPKDTVRNMDIYPVKLTQDAIMVDVSGAATTKFQGAGRGGSDTSIDANNVFALQPRTYLEGSGPDGMHSRASCYPINIPDLCSPPQGCRKGALSGLCQ